jgi:hypothetical protein
LKLVLHRRLRQSQNDIVQVAMLKRELGDTGLDKIDLVVVEHDEGGMRV